MIPNDIHNSSRLEEFNERFEIDSPLKQVNFQIETEVSLIIYFEWILRLTTKNNFPGLWEYFKENKEFLFRWGWRC